MEPDQIVSALRRHAPLALAHIVLDAIIGLAVALLRILLPPYIKQKLNDSSSAFSSQVSASVTMRYP